MPQRRDHKRVLIYSHDSFGLGTAADRESASQGPSFDADRELHAGSEYDWSKPRHSSAAGH